MTDWFLINWWLTDWSINDRLSVQLIFFCHNVSLLSFVGRVLHDGTNCGYIHVRDDNPTPYLPPLLSEEYGWSLYPVSWFLVLSPGVARLFQLLVLWSDGRLCWLTPSGGVDLGRLLLCPEERNPLSEMKKMNEWKKFEK